MKLFEMSFGGTTINYLEEYANTKEVREKDKLPKKEQVKRNIR